MARRKYPDDMFDFETWFDEIKGNIFRIRVYRRVGDWTPYEFSHPEEVPSQYIDGNAFIYCTIDEAIALPDGDVFLGIRYYDIDTKTPANFLEYNKLSNINLIQVDDDNGIQKEMGDEYDDD